MANELRVLIVEDSSDDALLLVRELKRGGFEPSFTIIATSAAMQKALDDNKWDIVLADYSLPNFSGTEALDLMKSKGIDLPFILVSGSIGEDTAVAAMKAGAHDYIMKNNLKRLLPAVKREIQESIERQNRRKAEQALLASEKKYSTLVEKSNDGIIIIQDGLIKFANSRMLELTGFTLEAAIGMPFIDFVAPEYRASVADSYKKRMSGKEVPSGYEIGIIARDGRTIPVEISASIMEYEGKIADMAIVRDVTEHKKAEEALRKSEEFNASLLESSPNPIYVIEADSSIKYLNPALGRLTGFTMQELEGRKPPFPWWPENAREQHLKLFHEGLVAGGAKEEKHFRKKNDELFWVELTSTNIMKDGELKYHMTNWVDITERKKAVEALQESEEFSTNLLENAPHPVNVVSFDSSIVYVNPALERLTGYPKEELIWHKAPYPYWPKGSNYADALTSDLKNPGGTIERLFQKKNGQTFWVQMTMAPIKRLGGGYLLGNWVDITERKKAEEAVKIFSQAIATAIDAIAITDMKGAITYANTAMEDTYGYGKGELLDKPVLCLNANPESASEIMSSLIKKGGWRGEIEAIKKNRETFPALLSISIISDDKGKPIALMGASRDITERKLAEEKIKQRAKEWRTTFDSISDAISIQDSDYKLLKVNRAFAGSFGKRPVELIGKTCYEAIYKRKEPCSHCNYPDVVRTKKPSTMEIYIQDSRRYIEMTMSPLFNEKSEVIGCVRVARDITERKRMQESMRKSEENFRNSLDDSPLGIRIVTAAGETLYANKAILDIYGYASVEEFKGTPTNKRYTPDSLAEQRQRQEKRERGEYLPPTYEINIVRKDGEIRHLEVSRKEVLWDGEMRAQLIYKDVTERNKMQEHLIITDRLASVGELASGIAHELNNPLTSVIGFSELLMDKDLPPDVLEDLKLINSEAQRTARVVRGLLTFARKHELVKQPVNVHNVIENVLELRAYEHRVNNIEVVKLLMPGIPEITGDYFQLQQVFLNIVINAEYFMIQTHGKGKLSITTDRSEDMVRIAISDDGPGISEETIRHLFTPFFTTKPVGKGTGLGLSICHGIITGHNGKIYVKNGNAQGATFVIELPISEGKS